MTSTLIVDKHTLALVSIYAKGEPNGTADHVPERRLGVLGVVLILIGFTLQSLQYWTTLLDVTVR